MGKIDYAAFQKASEYHNEQTSKYEADGFTFAQDFRKRITESLGCPADRVIFVRWEKVDKDYPSDKVIRQSLNRLLWLDEDAFWNFGVVIFTDDKQRWLKVLLRVKIVDDRYTVRYGDKEIEATTSEQREALVSDILQDIIQWLMTKHDDFVHGRHKQKPELGFRVSGSE